MKITIVVVEAHEKRANPSAMGHYDSSISYTIDVDEGDNAEDIVTSYQFFARQQVAVECDIWVNGILTREAQDRARNDLQWIVDRLENRLPDDRDAEQFEKKLALLHPSEWAEWRAKLKSAQGEFLSRIKGDLDRIVEKAGRKQLSPREISEYLELKHRLPEEEERQGYIDKMNDAIAAYELSQAPQPEEAATQVESKGSGTEEVPF